ncbi:MAG: VCBS repeat-containing protein [Rhodobacteraceae bacterium]|nr:VCBS repeat-containing protein [Paracoccaceae bacterium]
MPLAATAEIVSASYAEPTQRYQHGVFGETEEWGDLAFGLSDGQTMILRLPETRVFEDIAPRLVDVDGDGAPEMSVVETDLSLGARLAIYDEAGFVAATPFIGQTHRWLAPIGVADLDGDGLVELAYIDRPHLARLLRVWRFQDGTLVEVAQAEGLTNHRLGDPAISGGLRDCGAGPEMITADARWSRLVASRLVGGRIESRFVAEGVDFAAALDCRLP